MRALSAGKRPGKQGLPHLTGRTWGKGTQERVVAKRRPKLEAYLKEVVSLAASFPAIRRLVVQFMTDGMSPGSGRPSSEHSLSSSAGDAGRRGRLSSMSSSCYMCGRPLAPDLAPPAGESASGELHLFCSATCEAYFDRARALGMEVDRTAQSAVLAPARTSAASDPDAGRAAPAAISSPRSAAGSAEAVVVSRPSLDPSAESSRQLLLRAAGATRSDGGPGPLGAPGATPGQVAVFRDSSAAAPGQAAEGADPAEAVTQPVLLGSTQAPEEEAARSAVVGASGSRRGHHAAAASEFGVAGDDSPAPPLRETRRRTMLASLGDSLRRMSTTAESSAQQSNEAVVKRGGHLWKRGGFRGGRQNWKRRFFCLMDRALHYYQETTPTLLGVMPLVGSATPGPAALGGGSAFFATVKLLTEAEARQAGAPARASKDGRWAFSVSTPQRVLLLCAENAADRQSWADAVTALVAKHRATHVSRHSMGPWLARPAPVNPAAPPPSPSPSTSAAGGAAPAADTAPAWGMHSPSGFRPHPAALALRQAEAALGIGDGRPGGSPFPRSPSLYVGSPSSIVSGGGRGRDAQPPGRLRRPRTTLMDVVAQREAGADAAGSVGEAGVGVAGLGSPLADASSGASARGSLARPADGSAAAQPATASSGERSARGSAQGWHRPSGTLPLLPTPQPDFAEAQTAEGAARRPSLTAGGLSPIAAEDGRSKPRNRLRAQSNAYASTSRSPPPPPDRRKRSASSVSTPRAGSGATPPPPPPRGHATQSPRETEPLAPPTLADPVPLTPNTPQTSVAGSQPRHSVASARGMLGEEWMPQLSGGTWEVAEDEIEVTERIGEGAFGDVYRGRLWGTDVAVKLVRKGVAELGSEALEALRAEVTVLSQLRHPNVVLYLGAGTRPPSVFIVTEWCERGDLNCLLYDTAAPLSVAARVRLALHAAQGLTYLHSQRRGIVHRDLKSHNLLLTRHYILKVADFGLTVFQGELAKVAAPEDAATEEDAAAPGGGPADGAVGTPQWMAPEVLEGHRYDEKVDVYSFGVVLAELCSRVEPYSDRFKRWDFVEAVLEEGAAPTMPLWADAPPPVDDVIAAEAQLTTLEARTKPPQAAAAQPQAARQRSHSNASGHSDAHSTSSRRRQAAPLGASAPTTDGSGPGSLGGGAPPLAPPRTASRPPPGAASPTYRCPSSRGRCRTPRA